MIETLQREGASLPETQVGGWSAESWVEAMRDIESLEEAEAGEEYEIAYNRSIENCFSQQARNDYAFRVYGPSYYESDSEKADVLLIDHLQKLNIRDKEIDGRYQDRLEAEYRDMSERLCRSTGGAALAGCLPEPGGAA